MRRHVLATLGLTTWLALGFASEARAQPRLEVGATLVNAIVATDSSETLTTVGIPSGGFGILNPGVYASIFLGTRLAIEPQLGFVGYWADGDSGHVVNVVGQFDYFLLGTQGRSPYVFGTAGVIGTTGGETRNSFGAGLGYRIPVGDRLTVRVDGRYTRLTAAFDGDEGDTFGFSISIGGIFARN